MTYSQDLRWIACKLYHERYRSFRKTAAVLEIGKSTIQRWVTGHPITRRITARESKARRATALVVEALQGNPFHSAASLALDLRNKGLFLSRSTVTRCIRRGGWSRKQTAKTVLRARDQEEREAHFVAHMKGLIQQNADWISIDETCIWTDFVPAKGYSPRGQRLVLPERLPGGCWKKLSLLMAIHRGGVIHSFTKEGGINGDDFAHFLRSIPSEHRGKPIIMDNAAIHRTKAVKAALASQEFEGVFTAPYRPDWNPIEHSFSSIKHHFRTLWAIRCVRERLMRAVAAVPPSCWENCYRAVSDRLIKQLKAAPDT